jgi:hypothetical protein
MVCFFLFFFFFFFFPRASFQFFNQIIEEELDCGPNSGNWREGV